MFTGLPRNLGTVDLSQGVVQLPGMLFIATLNGPLPRRDLPLGRLDPLHRHRVERQEIVPPIMPVLGAAVRDTAGRLERRDDLARVHGVARDGRPDEHGGVPVRLV